MSRLIFRDQGHVYELDGRPIPSNTTIIKAAGLIDDQWFTEESRERGTAVHQACHFLGEGDLDWSSVKPEYLPYVEAYADFVLKSGIQIDIHEFPIWSDKFFYATTPDILGVLNGRRCLINLKTGAPSAWVGLQLAGEKLATIERIKANDLEWVKTLQWVNGHPWPEDRFALQLKKNGTSKLIPFERKSDESAFVGMVALHHWKASA